MAPKNASRPSRNGRVRRAVPVQELANASSPASVRSDATSKSGRRGEERRRRRPRSLRARSSRSRRPAGRPGPRTSAARSSIRACSAASRGEVGSGTDASGCPGSRRSVPRPEHGASSRTRVEARRERQRLGDVRPGRRERTRRPAAATVGASRSTRRPRTSVATIRPRLSMAAAIAVVLPPGDAQASRMRSPRAAPTSSATSCDASSCTTNSPSPASGVSSGLPRRTIEAVTARIAVGSVSTPSASRRSASVVA